MATAVASPAVGATCREIQFADRVKAGGADLVLNGLGIRKATLLRIKVYVAGLYLPQKSSDAGAILGANGRWQLVLHFVRDVDASDIRDAFQEGFEKAAGDKRAGLQTRIAALNAQMVDFKTGQSLTFTRHPTTGVTVDVNGKGGAAIEGADFATALLAIWLGPKPPNEDLKTGLLGGPCEWSATARAGRGRRRGACSPTAKPPIPGPAMPLARGTPPPPQAAGPSRRRRPRPRRRRRDCRHRRRARRARGGR
jgi:hypothetical protein